MAANETRLRSGIAYCSTDRIGGDVAVSYGGLEIRRQGVVGGLDVPQLGGELQGGVHVDDVVATGDDVRFAHAGRAQGSGRILRARGDVHVGNLAVAVSGGVADRIAVRGREKEVG